MVSMCGGWGVEAHSSVLSTSSLFILNRGAKLSGRVLKIRGMDLVAVFFFHSFGFFCGFNLMMIVILFEGI